ncbi:MAG: hypothetical protein ACI8ZW_001515 [Yoonia sp.]|jgi:hypothetical protein
MFLLECIRGSNCVLQDQLRKSLNFRLKSLGLLKIAFLCMRPCESMGHCG